jgi:hypothetical protein
MREGFAPCLNSQEKAASYAGNQFPQHLTLSQEVQRTWNRVAAQIFAKDFDYDEPLTCPSCDVRSLKFFFAHHDVGNRGGFWMWCSACHRYSHSSCAVPIWWVQRDNIPLSELTPEPDWFEENWERLWH